MTEDQVRKGKRGRGRGSQLLMIYNLEECYHPQPHIHVCICGGCPRGGFGYKFCGPQFPGDLKADEQMKVDLWFRMEKGKGEGNFDQIQGEFQTTTEEIGAFRFEIKDGIVTERFCNVPPEEMRRGIVRETSCDRCQKEAD